MACAAAIVLLAVPAMGDAYLNNPRGSNNKLHEQENGRVNTYRLFDPKQRQRGVPSGLALRRGHVQVPEHG